LTEGNDSADSDIDIAVGGISGKEFFKAVASLPLMVNHRVDLLDFDILPPRYQKNIEKNGVLLYAN
jgi:predicted nucleotidyltransferase